jgi:hypothetical protein
MYVSHLNEHRRLQRISGRAREESATFLSETVQAYLAGEPAPAAEPAVSEDSDERRRWGRVASGGEVIVRRLGGFNFQVALHDVSAGGCRVEMLEPSEPGDNVITRLPQLEPLGSTVCWADGTMTGIKFLTTIHPAVFDMVVTRLADEPAAAA